MTDGSSASHQTLLDRYQPYRPWAEYGFWIAMYLLEAAINTVIVDIDVARVHATFAPWEPGVWEWTSHLVGLALVPAVIWFSRRVPLRFGCLRRNIPLHVLATVA